MTLNATRIEILLGERNLTKAALAGRCGMSRQNISAIVRRGTAEPRTVARLAAGLGVRVEEIIKERDKLPELWNQVERFVAMQARRRVLLSDGLGGVEAEDLYQSGYIALVAAAESYNPETGRSFISWLALALKTAFAEAGGYRNRKQALDPLHRAGSLDAPISRDEDDGTLADLQADPGAAQDFQDMEDRLYREQLHNALEKALAELPDNQAAL